MKIRYIKKRINKNITAQLWIKSIKGWKHILNNKSVLISNKVGPVYIEFEDNVNELDKTRIFVAYDMLQYDISEFKKLCKKWSIFDKFCENFVKKYIKTYE